jgi:type IV secretion system protein VirB8
MDRPVEDYLDQASGWERDRNEQFRASARTAWIVAGCATGAALLAVGAVASLTPLKRVEPFLVRVDSSTGVVDVVPAYAGKAEFPDTVIRHLVTEYVTQRERYLPMLAETDYEATGAFHSAPMNQAWAAAWAKANPESPLNRYTGDTHVTVQVQSVTFLKQGPESMDVVQVRFQTATQRALGANPELAHYVATLKTAFGPPSADTRLRALNPLGFKVLEYRREPEVVGPIVPVVSTAASSQGGRP